jgi:F-type H+-transporting ATPase subunit delta
LSGKSTFSNSTSKSYALALYELSKEGSTLTKVEEEVRALNKLLNESKDFKEVILNPMITKEDKQKILFKISDQSNFSETIKKFLGFITTKNRLFFLEKIIESFLNLVSANKGEVKAKLISSKELTKGQQEKIKSELSEKFKSPLNIDYKYDPGLIGGLTIQIGSVMVDTSIKTKLKKLEKNMVEI